MSKLWTRFEGVERMPRRAKNPPLPNDETIYQFIERRINVLTHQIAAMKACERRLLAELSTVQKSLHDISGETVTLGKD
jgi:hypothetical protein